MADVKANCAPCGKSLKEQKDLECAKEIAPKAKNLQDKDQKQCK